MTLALGVELLGGRYVATAYNDRDAAEWPPHPARLFSALVATWADQDHEDTPSASREHEALGFLEGLPPPIVLASKTQDAHARTVAPVYVPVNDVSTVSAPSRDKLDEARARLEGAREPKVRAKIEKEIAKLEQKLLDDTAKAIAVPRSFAKEDFGGKILPWTRTRQPRTFPSITPVDATFALVWPEVTMPEALGRALDGLLARVVRLGHSSSQVLVRRWTDAEVAGARGRLEAFEPDEHHGDLVLRWVAPGQSTRLAEAFALHRETEPRVLPARFVRYREGALEARRELPCSVFDAQPIVYARVGGPRLPVTSVVGIAGQLRRALMAAADQPVAEILSGHGADGAPATRPHVAITPLPFVASEHADGALLGVAVWIPRDATEAERRAVMRAVGRLEEGPDAVDQGEVATVPLKLGDAGILELERVVWGEHRRWTLRPSTWTRASRRWASVTPVALDKNPGDLHDASPARRAAAFEEAREIIARAVGWIGLPRPLEIDVVRSAVVPGTAKPRVYPRFPASTDKPQRVLVHVRLEFAEAVRGPVLLGAGRYLGLGLCMPVLEEGAGVEGARTNEVRK